MTASVTPEPAPVPTPPPAPAAPQPSALARPDGVSEAEWNALGDPGRAALIRERAAKAQAEKALADALARVKSFEDAQKSEAERAAEQLQAAREAAERASALALRYEVAAAKGLDLALAPRLVGSSRQELEADADVLLARFAPPSPQPPNQPHVNRPVPTIGTTPPRPQNIPLRDQIAAAEAAGDRKLAAALKALMLGQ